jgi:hypothetical protein
MVRSRLNGSLTVVLQVLDEVLLLRRWVFRGSAETAERSPEEIKNSVLASCGG